MKTSNLIILLVAVFLTSCNNKKSKNVEFKEDKIIQSLTKKHDGYIMINDTLYDSAETYVLIHNTK